MERGEQYEEAAHLVKARFEQLKSQRRVLTVEDEVLSDLVDIVKHLNAAVQVTRVPQILEALSPIILNFLLVLGLGADHFAI